MSCIHFTPRYDSTSTATVEIFIRSGSLLDDAEAREDILAGNRDPLGLKYSISSDGRVGFNGTQFAKSLPAAECYKVEVINTCTCKTKKNYTIAEIIMTLQIKKKQ